MTCGVVQQLAFTLVHNTRFFINKLFVMTILSPYNAVMPQAALYIHKGPPVGVTAAIYNTHKDMGGPEDHLNIFRLFPLFPIYF